MRVALFYFAFVAISGLVLPYFPKYLEAIGYSGAQRSNIIAVGPALLMFVPLAWGFVADKTGRTALLLKIACAGAAVAMVLFAAGRVTSYWSMFAIWLLYYFFQCALMPLADSLALVEARRIGTDYARLRLWGSISYIAVAFAFGQFLTSGGDIHVVPALTAALAIFVALCAHLLRQYGSGPHRVPPSIKDARELLLDPGLTWFLIAGAVHQAALSPYYILYSIHVEHLGLKQDVVSWSAALGVGAEITMFWFARPLFDRKPLLGLMGVSFIISSARWYLVAIVHNGPTLAALQIAHAFTFALCYAGAIRHLEKNVPEQMRVTGRALFAAISMGLGGVLGHKLAGYLCDSDGTAAAFKAAAALDLAALIPLIIAAKYYARRTEIVEPASTTEPLDDIPPPMTE